MSPPSWTCSEYVRWYEDEREMGEDGDEYMVLGVGLGQENVGCKRVRHGIGL